MGKMGEHQAGVLNSFSLKWIAIASMLIDHVGMVLFPGVIVLRVIGRVAFPIFVYLLVEGFYHTKNVQRYEIRLAVFALISEIPFDLAQSGRLFYPASQNVFFTLALGMIMMDLLHRWQRRYICQAAVVAACMLAAGLLSTDYGVGGILLVFAFYCFRKRPVYQIISLAVISLAFYARIECFSLLAFLPILLYNGKRGASLKYVFYLFYPVHLFVLALIADAGRGMVPRIWM